MVECFQKNFTKDNKKKIIIYGIGINTRAILSEADTSNVAGLMDASCEGEIIMGYPVLTVEEAAINGDCVVIVARNSVVPIIFKRIRELEDKWGLPVYNIHGERLIHKKAAAYENNNPYWEKSEESLIQCIRKRETVSFDIFDTLIIRKCMLPTDIFMMAEKELKRIGIASDGFAAARREAEIEIEDNHPDINGIYECLKEKMNWSSIESNTAKECELSLEIKNCVPREFMRSVYLKALEMGKKVILVSDMYLPLEEMKKILKKCGIEGYDRLYISCEENADKNSGKLFKKIIDDGYTDILHIGDNAVSDGRSAEACGIQSFTIWSPYELLVQSSLRDIMAYADSLERRCIIGYLQNKLFDNPFLLGRDKGMVNIGDNYTAGYIFLAPIVRCFLSFLADTLKKQRMDRVLFCARDGYVIWKLYQRMLETKMGEGLPKGLYFKTSRRAITVASIRNVQDILVILKKPYNAAMGELLSERFGIMPDAEDITAKERAVSTENPEKVEEYILKYEKQILKNAEEERASYYKYMKACELAAGKAENIAVYDFCSGGTIQHYLTQLIDADVRGIYFATVNLPNMFYNDSGSMNTLFGNIGQYEMHYHLAQHYMFMEAVLTDEHGTLIRFDADGTPIYDEAENSRRNYAIINEIQNGIIDYCEDTLHENWYENYEDVKEICDKILGLLFQPEVCHVTAEIKDSVRAESKYDFLGAYSAWNEE